MNDAQIERMLSDIYRCWLVENKDVILMDAIDSKSILSKLSVFDKTRDIVKRHLIHINEIEKSKESIINSMYTKVVHSESKSAWNVVGTEWGKKYKIARIPYMSLPDYTDDAEQNKQEAYERALFISNCFNEERSKHD